jgi:hypothetical protein
MVSTRLKSAAAGPFKPNSDTEIDLIDAEIDSAERHLERIPIVELPELGTRRVFAFGNLHGA